MRGADMHVRKDDMVLVLTGEYRGKKGRVLKVFPKENRVLVEGVNFIKRHMRPSSKLPQGGIIEKEAPIHASNVMVICPKCNTPTRTRREFLGEEGKPSRRKARVCKNCGEMIHAVG
ncbi:MAG: 50S ribosomal protein L24 [Calditrichaeota bacterium]|nr:MAG: 50S ribosomal protein L24 [Calditrichota bacterium]